MNNNSPTKVAQREAYGLALAGLGQQMPEVVVLDADVSGSTRTIYFAQKFPQRFFNFGIAEQNMMAAATGMAKVGLIPFVNSFSFLTTFRAADQFRSSIIYPGLNVKVIATYAGLSDSYDGPTHQETSDLAWVRALPNLTVLVPVDGVEAAKALPVIAQHEGPVWMRLSRNPTPVFTPDDFQFKLGPATIRRQGKDLTLIACGVILGRVLEAAEQLSRTGIDASVLSLSTLKPLDEAAILEAARTTGAIVTCEEHNVFGGLGAAVCETVSRSCPVPVLRLGMPDTFAESGDYEQLLDQYGLAVADIFRAGGEAVQLKRKGKTKNAE